MIFYEDTLSEQLRIETAIKKYGYAPEHNFWWYQCQAEEGSKNIFAESKDGSGLFNIEEKNKKGCTVFSSPIAGPANRIPVIIEYLTSIFQSGKIEKVTLELEDELYKNFSVQTRLQDYRDVKEKFNHIVSLGMFEHVGYKNYRAYNYRPLQKSQNRAHNSTNGHPNISSGQIDAVANRL